MPLSADLLTVARTLLHEHASAPPGAAGLRRAVSTAYYAVFHKLVETAAIRFVGASRAHTPAFELIYRGFDHRQMKEACDAVARRELSAKHRNVFRRDAFSQDMRDFAISFPDLQKRRHHADYAPAASILPSDVASLLDAVDEALLSLSRVAEEELADVLALMLVGARG